MHPRLPPDIIDVDALPVEENDDAVLCTGFRINRQQESFTFSSSVKRPPLSSHRTTTVVKHEPVASSSRMPVPSGPPQLNLQVVARNNPTCTYTRPGLSEMVEQERRKKRIAMDISERPSKKPATTSTIAVVNTPSRQKDKRKQQSWEDEGMQVIDLCSSDDDTQAKKPRLRSEDNNLEVDRKPVIYTNNENDFQMDVSDDVCNNYDANNFISRTDTLLPQQLSFQELEYDSEEEYANYMASLDISDESNWKALPANNKAEDLSRNVDIEVQPSRPAELRPLRPKYFAVHYPVTPIDPSFKDSDKFVWAQLNSIRGLRPRLKPPPRLRIAGYVPLLGRTRSLKLFQDLGYDRLGVVESHRQVASGHVNKIVQVQGAIIACAAACGGQADYSQEDREAPLPPGNNAGTLVVLHQNRCHVVDAHCIDHRASSSKKYYTVNDVLFNPLNPEQFVSTGHDFKVQLWQLPKVDEMETSDGPRMLNSIKLGDVAQDLVCSSDGTNLAVSCRDGTVSVFKTMNLFTSLPWDRTTPSPDPEAKLRVAPLNTDHAAGTVLWGCGPTERHIYTSSEPHDPEGDSKDKGFHHAHDVSRGVRLFRFDAEESGDTGTISPDGRSYALFTSGENNRHPLRLYDIARMSKYSVAEVALEPCVSQAASFEVVKATFSSEGRLLAVARNDNTLHMYDVRALSKGPLVMFKHDELDAIGSTGYGVVHASWVEGRDRRRVGIVSGGNDGCVRLWDPSIASSDKSQGKVLARTEFDVGYFSIGDMWQGEKPLVLGHGGGGLYVYDLLDGDGLPIASHTYRGC